MPSSKASKNKEDSTIVNYHVIGTSHFRCDSYKEVSTLIRETKPDGVIIELDPERLLRLTLDDATVRTAAITDPTVDAAGLIGDRWFGGDFLSAIETSKELDIPIFLGDEYPIETKQRFTNTLFDANSYSPKKLLAAMTSLFRPRLGRKIGRNSDILPVDVLSTFLEDPRKLLPLAATLVLPFLAVSFTIVLDANGANASSNDSLLLDNVLEILATSASLVVSFLASCKVYNNLIVDRDFVLTSNVQRAAATMALLKSNKLLRVRWTFSVNENEDGVATEQVLSPSSKHSSSKIPLFTLKNGLEKNAERNLNLFEPRWLKMVDRLLLSKTPEASSSKESFTIDSTSDRPTIGCVTCTNKFYSAINAANTTAAPNNGDPALFQEGRYADVIFRRRGRFGEVTSVTEGSRPSGARKVGVKMVGKEAFDLSSSKDENGRDRISVVRDGYLTASGLEAIDEDEIVIDTDVEDTPDEINIVVVVGLLHANGVLDCLSGTNTGNKDK